MGGRGASLGIRKRLPQYKNAIIESSKVKGYLLHNKGTHSKDFYEVGYKPTDSSVLIKDIKNNLLFSTANESYKKESVYKTYIVDMDLGVTNSKRFRTIWELKYKSSKPRFITAFRIRRK